LSRKENPQGFALRYNYNDQKSGTPKRAAEDRLRKL
jgi:hypothetical protein